MKKQILIPIFLLILLSVACSLGGSKATEVPATAIVRPTNTAVNPTLPPQPTAVPTEEEAAAVVEPTEDNTPDCLVTGTYQFDEVSPCWPNDPEELYSVTTVSDMRKVFSGIKDGAFEFEVKIPEEMYLYSFNTNNLYPEVILETNVLKIEPSVNKNGFILACHVNEDGWYEARMDSGGYYHVYQYETINKELGKNPYTTLSEGGTPAIQVGQNKVNTMRFECMQDSLTLLINGEEVWYEKMNVNSGGAIGIGVNTFAGKYPVHIGFDYLTVLTP